MKDTLSTCQVGEKIWSALAPSGSSCRRANDGRIRAQITGPLARIMTEILEGVACPAACERAWTPGTAYRLVLGLAHFIASKKSHERTGPYLFAVIFSTKPE